MNDHYSFALGKSREDRRKPVRGSVMDSVTALLCGAECPSVRENRGGMVERWKPGMIPAEEQYFLMLEALQQ